MPPTRRPPPFRPPDSVMMTFRRNSSLRQLLKTKIQASALIRQRWFTFPDLEKIVRHIIRIEQCYDKHNANILLPNEELERALGVWGLDLSQLGNFLSVHLINEQGPVDSFKPQTETNPYFVPPLYREDYGILPSPCLLQQIHQMENTTDLATVPGSREFSIGENFRKLLKLPPKNTFTFKNIIEATLRYITHHQTDFFDFRNTDICHCKGTELQRIFQVYAFSRDQVSSLVKLQLITTSPKEQSTEDKNGTQLQTTPTPPDKHPEPPKGVETNTLNVRTQSRDGNPGPEAP